MMPLWMTAIRPDWSVCGCAFGVVGAPWVAQRVWPMPTVPIGMPASSSCSSTESLPAAFLMSRPVAVHHRDAGRVVAPVLEPAQPLDEELGGLPGSDVAYDTAHRAMILTARVLGRRPPVPPLRLAWVPRRSVGRSARCRTAGCGASDRPRRAGVRPGRRRRHRRNACAAARTADPAATTWAPWPSRWCSGATTPPGPDTVTPDVARRCKIRATPRGASRPMWRAGYITPPFPSPPMTAPRSRMARATLASPTGARSAGWPRLHGPHPQPPGWSKGSRPRSAVCRGFAASIQHRADRERQRVVLADRPAALVHDAPGGPRRGPRRGRGRRRSPGPAGRARPGSPVPARAPAESARRAPG